MYAEDLAYVHDAGFGDYAAKAAPEIARLLARHGIRRGRVVEFGCGGGTIARHLADRGYDVLGVDQSPAMIRMARANAPRAAFTVGSLATTRIPRCAAVVAVGEVVSYIVAEKGPAVKARRHEEGLRTFFRSAATALEPGGLLMFDFMESAEGRTFDARSRAGVDWAIVMRATAKGRVLTRDLAIFRKVGKDYRHTREIHRVRLYRRSEIAAVLRRAGLDVVAMRRSIGSVPLIRSDLFVIARTPAGADVQ